MAFESGICNIKPISFDRGLGELKYLDETGVEQTLKMRVTGPGYIPNDWSETQEVEVVEDIKYTGYRNE